jgi:integrase/recombinase XerC
MLRAFLLWNERFANGQRGLRESIRNIPQPLPRTIFATEEERQRLLQMASPGMRFFLLLCADLGLRHGTAVRITPNDYNPTDRTIFFTTKGSQQQTLPVTDEIAQTFNFLPPNADPNMSVVAILNRMSNTHLKKTGAMTNAFIKLRAAAGIRPQLRIHDLRRTAAETAWAATKDVRAVQAILGHTSIATTNRYLHNRTNPEQLRITVEAMQRIHQQHAAAADTTRKERTQ